MTIGDAAAKSGNNAHLLAINDIRQGENPNQDFVWEVSRFF